MTALGALLAGCSGSQSAVGVVVPSDSASASACQALLATVPAKLEGRARRTTDPVSPRVAAWGSPAVVLRCGVPPVTTDAGDHVTVNGIGWLTAGQTGSVVVWTTTGLSPAVELSVPASIDDQENLLTDLGAALGAALSRVPAPASTAATPGGSGPAATSSPASSG